MLSPCLVLSAQIAANLAAEVAHYVEETRTKDMYVMERQHAINQGDLNIQRHIRANSCRVPHPKEEQIMKAVLAQFDLALVQRDSAVDGTNRLFETVGYLNPLCSLSLSLPNPICFKPVAYRTSVDTSPALSNVVTLG